MAKTNIYSFKIDGTVVHPLYTDNQGKQWTRFQDQAFYRYDFAQRFTLLEDDWNLINTEDEEHEFTFVCQRLVDTTPTWEDYFVGYFTKFDVEQFDEDRMIIEMKPLPNDRYRLLLEKWDKEFNIIDLGMQKTTIRYKRYPLLQLYQSFDGNKAYIANISAGRIWYEQLPAPLTSADLLAEEFASVGGLPVNGVAYFTGSGHISPDVSGNYTTDLVTFTREDNAYVVEYNSGAGQWEIKDNPGGTVRYTYVGATILQNVVTFTSVANSDETRYMNLNVQARILCNNTGTVGGLATVELTDNGLTDHHGYSHAASNNLSWVWDDFKIHEENQVAESIYGKVAEGMLYDVGNYHIAPSTGDDWYPLYKPKWVEGSFWFKISSTVQGWIDECVETVTLEDAYRLDRVIKALLNEIDPVLLHEGVTLSESFFLYKDPQVLTGLPNDGIPYLTAKSNITKPNYDQAATRVMVKLKDLLRALMLMFHGLKFDITDDDRFRLEHEQFYANGGNYNSEVVGIDLNAYNEPQSGLSWGYFTNQYRYEKRDIPGRIVLSWLDEVTDFFQGTGIEILSPMAVKEDSKEETIPLIVTDLDFIYSNPNQVSNTGLVMLEVEDIAGVLWVKNPTFLDPSTGFTAPIQNGNYALTILDERYGIYNSPAKSVEINGVTYAVTPVTRPKVQDLEMVLNEDIDVIKLVWSAIGKGRVERVLHVMETNEHRMTLNHKV